MTFIRGMGAISPQETYLGNLPAHAEAFESHLLLCLEPEYKEYINPRFSRRMSRVIKMGLTAALLSLKEAKVEIPDAIITGTGWGCIKDTEKFLTSIIKNNEQFLNPASFINSTHNTIGSQIAMVLKCNQYNQTYANGELSFESALLDGILLLNENAVTNVLLGGIDEMTEVFYSISRRFRIWKKNAMVNLNLISQPSKGTLPGEGAAYFLLTNQKSNQNYAAIKAVSTLRKPKNNTAVEVHLTRFLEQNQITISKINLVLMGKNGDKKQDELYSMIQNLCFPNTSIGYYKHLCGEYFTSTSFALWLAAHMLKSQIVPEYISQDFSNRSGFNRILIYNQHNNLNHSFILLEKV